MASLGPGVRKQMGMVPAIKGTQTEWERERRTSQTTPPTNITTPTFTSPQNILRHNTSYPSIYSTSQQILLYHLWYHLMHTTTESELFFVMSSRCHDRSSKLTPLHDKSGSDDQRRPMLLRFSSVVVWLGLVWFAFFRRLF